MSIVRGLVHGAVSGYLVRGIQVIVSLSIIPFLLQDKMLGLSGYGQVFTLVALFAMISMLLDGVKLSLSRFIGQSLKNENDLLEVIGSGNKAVFMMTMLIASVIYMFDGYLLSFIGMQATTEIKDSLLILLIVYIIESVCYSLQVLLHATDRTYVVNLVAGLEVVGRNGAVALYFYLVGASIFAYFLIQLIFTILRISVYYLYSRNIVSGLFRSLFSSRLRSAMPMLRYSIPASGKGLSALLVFQGAVLVSSKYLGPEAAGAVSLVVGTVRNYLVQMLHGVFRPMMIPLLSKMDMANMPDEKIKLIGMANSVYTAFLFLIGFTLIAAMPDLITLWLGPEYLYIVIGVQVIVFAAIFELSGAIKVAILISQGKVKLLTLMEMPLAIIVFIAMIVLIKIQPSWELIVILSMIFGVLSGGGIVEWVFSKRMPSNVRNMIKMDVGRLLASLIMFGIAILISSQDINNSNIMSGIIRSVLAMLISAAFVHVFIIKFQNILSCSRLLNNMMKH